MKKLFILVLPLILVQLVSFHAVADEAIEKCLKSWGTHPFGKNPKFKTLAANVKVFGVGKDPIDNDITAEPALVLVKAAVNVMGGSSYELLNPNGWYCFSASVNVMGGLIIKAHCEAHLASASGDTTVMGSNDSDTKAVTVMGSSKVERVGCK